MQVPTHLPPGVDPESDDDGDGLLAKYDLCLDTEMDRWTGVDGCGELDDGDIDGFPTDRDLCPGTPRGEAVDGYGCSESQNEVLSQRLHPRLRKRGTAGQRPGDTSNQPVQSASKDDPGATPNVPPTGWRPKATTNSGSGSESQVVADTSDAINDGEIGKNGFATFTLDPKGAWPVVLQTLAKNVRELDDGIAISGTIVVEVPGDQQLTFAEAEVELKYGSDRSQGLQSFQGACRLPFPTGGLMKGVNVGDLATASVGYDVGAKIENVDAPLEDSRKYFFFNFSTGLSASIANASLSVGPGVATTMAIDPSDPSLFVKGAFGGLLGPVEEASVGLSYGGHLPFAPAKTWGIDTNVASFNGHLWLGGKVNLVKIPISIGGNTVIDLDPNDDGKSFFQDPAGGYGFGSNSDVFLSLGYGIVGLELPLGGATVVGQMSSTAGHAYYTGEIGAGTAFGDLLPIQNTQALQAAGYFSSNLQDSYFKAQGEAVSFDATTLGKWTSINIEPMAMTKITLDIDKNGARIKGKASKSFSPLIALSGDVNAEAFFNGKPDGWYIKLDGNMGVKGVTLANAHAELGKAGANVSGKMKTPLSEIKMVGTITASNVNLQGTAQVKTPVVKGKKIIEEVICGVEIVTDKARCGAEWVKDAGECGMHYTSSGAECGYETVTDAAKCGSEYISSGAECGYETVTDAAICGVDTVSGVAKCGAKCVSSMFKKCKCKLPKTCKVAKKCDVPKTCTVAKSCNVANSCEVTKTCEKTKMCKNEVTIPNVNFGNFTGDVTLKLGNNGLSGEVSGNYCPPNGACTKLTGGYIETSNGKFEACVKVPAVGKVCSGF